MIKLTTMDGEPLWVNPSLMTSMFPKNGSTTICFVFPDDTVPVKEPPEEINKAIENHTLREIRYKEKLAHLAYAYSSGKKRTATNFGLETLTKENIKDVLDELASINAPPVEKIIEDNSLDNSVEDTTPTLGHVLEATVRNASSPAKIDPSTPGVDLKEYEIWSEGYRATGERGTAVFHGKMAGSTFNEACVRFFKMKDADFRNGKDAVDASLFDAERLTYWGCRLFPTEEEARKRFG